VVEADRFGPFYTRIVYRLPDGSTRVWTSRRHRLGLHLRRPARALLDVGHSVSPVAAVWLPRRLSWWMGVGYLAGCVVFLIALVLRVTTHLSGAGSYGWYLAAALVFLAANYCGFVSALNARDDLTDDPHGLRSYRWWGWRSDRIGYLVSSALVVASSMFVLRALAQLVLGPHVRWIGPATAVLTALGSLVFLVATGVEVREVRIRSLWWEPRNLAWWRASLSFLGCIGFVVGALGAVFAPVLPVVLGSTGSDYAFLAGMGLFLLGSYLILPELAQER
jgi:hypothetical protein